MSVVKVPVFIGGGINTDGSLNVKGNVEIGGELVFAQGSKFRIPASTEETGVLYQFRYNPSKEIMEIYLNDWINPFSSAVNYDPVTDSFKASNDTNEEFTFLTVDTNENIQGVTRIGVEDGSAAQPVIFSKNYGGSGLYFDPANGWVCAAVGGGQVLAVKSAGATIRRFDQQSTFIANFESVLTEIRANTKVTGDLEITGQLKVNGKVISLSDLEAFSA